MQQSAIIERMKRQIQMVVDFQRPSQRPDEKWCCADELILRFGRAYESGALPEGLEWGEPKLCYWNSAKRAMEDDRYVYVEGYGQMSGLPTMTEHAWLVERGSNKVIDLTLRLDAYFGIPFRTAYLRERWEALPEGVSLLDDWESEFPLLNMDETEIQKTVVDCER